MRRPAARFSGRDDENNHRRRHRWKAEWINRGADKDLRGNREAGLFLMVSDRTGPTFAKAPVGKPQRNVYVMARQMRVQRLTVMVSGLFGVEMDVHQRRADRASLYEDDESRRGQPAKHMAIVVKDAGTWHLTSF